MTAEQQYLKLVKRVLNKGTDVYNERTKKVCKTVINADLTYTANEMPLVTTRKSYWKQAIGEMLCYIRGYSNLDDFHKLGVHTWDANVANPVWQNGEGIRKLPVAIPKNKYLGRVYGVQGRHWVNPALERFDQLDKIYNNLRNGIDDRGEIITFWNPGELHMGCLRPCMFQHHFSILGNKLYLTSYQRSCDLLLGGNFNMVQVHFLLLIMAQITGLEPGEAYHKIVNVHIYQDQLEKVDTQLSRKPYAPPKLIINPDIKTLEDLETWVTMDDFKVEGYKHHDPINYPFTV